MPSPPLFRPTRVPPPALLMPIAGSEATPTRPLAQEGHRLADEVVGASDGVCDASMLIPRYRRMRHQYSVAEWAEIRDAFLPHGSTTRIDRERLTALAGAYVYCRDEGSNRHVGRLAQVLGARVRRHLASLGRSGGRTQESLRTVLQREYLPGRTRLDRIARAVGDPHWSSLDLAGKWGFIGDLLEAIPIIEAEADAVTEPSEALRRNIVQRRRRRFGLDVAEALQDHFAEGGEQNAEAVTRAVHERLSPEGVAFRRCSPGWHAFAHILLRRSEVTMATPEVFLAWLMRCARHPSSMGSPSYRTGPIPLRREADVTVAWMRTMQGPASDERS